MSSVFSLLDRRHMIKNTLYSNLNAHEFKLQRGEKAQLKNSDI